MPPVRRSKRLRQSPIATEVKPTRSARRNHSQTSPNPPPPRAKKAKPSYLQRPSADTQTDPNCKLRLFSLPREIFDHIITFLPPAAEVCLSLTCKTALHLVGTASWTYFRRSTQIYYRRSDMSLFELLQLDHPHLELCPRCEILHPPIKPPHSHRTTKFTKLCLGQTASMDYWPQTPEGGYSVAHTHINEAFALKPDKDTAGAGVDLFTGDFTISAHPTDTTHSDSNITYRLRSSAKRVKQNFILKQEHILRSPVASSTLDVTDITSLPLRVCAHLTTSTAPPPESQRTKLHAPNGPLLTHAIASVFPSSRRRGVDMSVFRPLCPSEAGQIDTGAKQEGFTWSCRTCPTKFRVELNDGTGEVVVTAWHCFGRDIFQAKRYWGWFVRREGVLLGPKKRNSEFFVRSNGVPDFVCE